MTLACCVHAPSPDTQASAQVCGRNPTSYCMCNFMLSPGDAGCGAHVAWSAQGGGVLDFWGELQCNEEAVMCGAQVTCECGAQGLKPLRTYIRHCPDAGPCHPWGETVFEH